MSDKENKTLPVALLVAGIGCIMIVSCCFVWVVVRCERWRRRRKYRPKPTNRYSINAAHIANGHELKDMEPRHLKPSVNLIHYSSKHSVTSQSIPSLLSADSIDDSIASEPLFGRNYEEDEPDSDYLAVHDLSIARILGSFPELPFYPPSVNNSTENVLNAKSGNPPVPIARPRSSVTTGRSKDFSINSSLYTDYVEKASVDGINKMHTGLGDATSTKSASSAESLKLEIPGGAIRIQDIQDVSGNFEFTRVKKVKKDKGASFTTTSGDSYPQPQASRPVFETEV